MPRCLGVLPHKSSLEFAGKEPLIKVQKKAPRRAYCLSPHKSNHLAGQAHRLPQPASQPSSALNLYHPSYPTQHEAERHLDRRCTSVSTETLAEHPTMLTSFPLSYRVASATHAVSLPSGVKISEETPLSIRSSPLNALKLSELMSDTQPLKVTELSDELKASQLQDIELGSLVKEFNETPAAEVEAAINRLQPEPRTAMRKVKKLSELKFYGRPNVRKVPAKQVEGEAASVVSGSSA